MHLHANTIRYRLRRGQELAALDLDDWDERLLAEVQLRMWHELRLFAEPMRSTAACLDRRNESIQYHMARLHHFGARRP
jgi:hypothetical protein